MKKRLLCTILFVAGHLVQAQWYFETSVTNNHLVSYELNNDNLVAPTPTILKSIKGIRDLSLGLGYLFSFRTLEQRLAADFETPFVRLGVGLGFEQFNLKTNAVINDVKYPNIYAMAQAQGRLGLHFTPLTFYQKNADANGNKQALFSLDVHGGVAYNYYTSATQQHQNKLIDLKNSAQFDDDYLSYFFGVGLQYTLSSFLQVYSRYGIDRAFEFTERSDDGVNERYQVYKNRLSVGLLIDLPASKKAKNMQRNDIDQIQKQLENNTRQLATIPQDDDSALYQRIAQLEQSVARQTQEINQLIANKSDGLVSKMHPEGFAYVLEFASIHFAIDSAVFNQDSQTENLLKVAEFLKQNQKMRLVLVGYADEMGNNEYNDKLSMQRAKNVYDFLVQDAGVNPASIQCIGAGETERFSENEFRKNRRTELLIITQ